MKYNKRVDVREAVLSILKRKGEADIYYLKSNLDSRKTIEGDTLYSELLEQLYFLEQKDKVQYIGHSIYKLN